MIHLIRFLFWSVVASNLKLPKEEAERIIRIAHEELQSNKKCVSDYSDLILQNVKNYRDFRAVLD